MMKILLSFRDEFKPIRISLSVDISKIIKIIYKKFRFTLSFTQKTFGKRPVLFLKSPI